MMMVGLVIRVVVAAVVVVAVAVALVAAEVAVIVAVEVGMVGSVFPNRARIGVHQQAGVDLPRRRRRPLHPSMSDNNINTTITMTYGLGALPLAIKDPEQVVAKETANPGEEEEDFLPQTSTREGWTRMTTLAVGPPVPSGCPRTYRNR